MTKQSKLRLSIIWRGNTIHVRARKNGQPLTQEDHIQIQILESEIANTDHFKDVPEDQEIHI